MVCRLLGDWDGGAVGRRSRAEGGGGHGGVEDGRNSSRRESLERLRRSRTGLHVARSLWCGFASSQRGETLAMACRHA